MKRRNFLQNTLAASIVAGLPRMVLAGGESSYTSVSNADYTLVLEQTPVSILPDTTSPAFTFNGAVPAPVLRVKQDKPVKIAVVNKLTQPTTIHWHGIRIDNAMDGVPWLTQTPIAPGETFVYEFTCPDAGTFWYHPHFNSLEQLSKGLVGPLIVEEQNPPAFDAEVVVGLKDWLLNGDGSFKAFTSPRHAARMGTLGNVAGVNGLVASEQKPISYDVPAGGAVRLRVLNMDNTRVFNISLRNELPAWVLAADGMPLAQPIPLDAYPIGAGMRVDIGIIAPSKINQTIKLYDRKGAFHFEICRLRTVESGLSQPRIDLPRLPLNPIPEPNLAQAEDLSFVFEWEGALSPVNEQGENQSVFWTINRRAWQHVHSANSLPEPLARLRRGHHYRISLKNNTPHQHPIHMHGEIFKVLASDKRDIVPHFADTVLVGKDETVTIALQTTNPGKWMFHCHVIEHMKTGLMGYIEIA